MNVLRGGSPKEGIALALELSGKAKEIIAVETKGAESLHASLQAGEIVELPEISSIAKTLGARKTEPFIFQNLKRLVSHSFVVSDKVAVQYMIEFLDHEKLLIEPATSCIIAAAMEHRELFENKRVVFVICGSNVSLSELEEWKKQFGLAL